MNTLKRLIRAGMIAAALSTSAVGAVSLSACATTASTQMQAGRGVNSLWASLDAVSVTLDGIAKAHIASGKPWPEANQVADDLHKATIAISAADAAFRAGDNATAQQNVATATALITTLIHISKNPA